MLTFALQHVALYRICSQSASDQLVASQGLLCGGGALQTVLRSFSDGLPAMMAWTYPCALLARDAVMLRAAKAPDAQLDANYTQQLSTRMLLAAGQARLK